MIHVGQDGQERPGVEDWTFIMTADHFMEKPLLLTTLSFAGQRTGFYGLRPCARSQASDASPPHYQNDFLSCEFLWRAIV